MEVNEKQQYKCRMYYANNFSSESRSPAGNELLRLRKDSTSNVWLLFPVTFYLKVLKEGKYYYCFTNEETEAENGDLPSCLIESV